MPDSAHDNMSMLPLTTTTHAGGTPADRNGTDDKHKTVLTSASTKGWFQPSIVVESARNGCAVHVVAPNDNLKWSGGAKCASIRRVLRAKQSFKQETTVQIMMNRSNDMDICSSTQLPSLSLLY